LKIFITGTFRSGTTLVSHILNQHSDLSITYDSVHFMRFAYRKFGKNQITPKNALLLAETMNDRLNKRFGKGIDVAEYKKRINTLHQLTYGALYDIFMQLYTKSVNWGEKTVLQWRNAGDILEMFDDIFIVHCLRDPRDILSSWKNETIAPGVDYLDAIGNCFDAMKYALINKERYGNRYVLLKYEDLVNEPANTTTKMCRELGIEFQPAMLDTHQFQNKVTQKKWEPNTAFGDKIEGISTNPIGRWKEHLPDEDLILCELTNRALMEKFQYPVSGKLDQIGIKEIYKALSKLQQSPLALNGVLNIIQNDEGVQRNPLKDTDPSTWETDVYKL